MMNTLGQMRLHFERPARKNAAAYAAECLTRTPRAENYPFRRQKVVTRKGNVTVTRVTEDVERREYVQLEERRNVAGGR